MRSILASTRQRDTRRNFRRRETRLCIARQISSPAPSSTAFRPYGLPHCARATGTPAGCRSLRPRSLDRHQERERRNLKIKQMEI